MSRKQYFCTYFDRNYLLRGLVLYQSLKDVGADFTLWALSLDDETYATLEALALPGLVPVRLTDLESHDAVLKAARPTRTRIEYYFTLTPSLPLFLLARNPEIDVISYLDADLKFYSNPETVLDAMNHSSVLIIPHGFPERLKALESHGKYNVGMVSFRNDPDGIACLKRWRRQCIDWCYDRVDAGRYADQGYLDDWPDSLEGVLVLDKPGVGLGPWNFMRFAIDARPNPPTVDGSPLTFYHFHAFKSLGAGLFDDGLAEYGAMDRGVRRNLYGGYVRDLKRAHRSLKTGHGANAASGRTNRSAFRSILRAIRRRGLLFSLGDVVVG